MKIHELDGKLLYQATLVGAQKVIQQRQWLNKINVFPVADGDTGSNLSSLMSTIIDKSQCFPDASQTLKSIADASLVGARGNSGIIFAQFLNGLSAESAGAKTLSTKQFGTVVKGAVQHAYNAVLEPVEGTILTTMRKWANACHQHSLTETNFVNLLNDSLKQANHALAETSNQLKVLQQEKVVDSGASGFVSFIEGMVSHIIDKTPVQEQTVEHTNFEEENHEHQFEAGQPPEFRYCTEALIKGSQLSHDAFTDYLRPLGDSLVIAGNEEHCRLHIHTNTPEKVFEHVGKGNTILQQKVDDMAKQYTMLHERAHDTALVVDSTADIPEELKDRFQIYTLPLNLYMDGSTYLDKLSITAETFYSKLDHLEEYPSTSQPSFTIVDQLLDGLTRQYRSVIVMSVSKIMSGTYQIIANAIERHKDKGCDIHLIDSKSSSGGLGLLSLKAARAIDEGKSATAIVKEIESAVEETQLFVTVDTLKYMIRSGRLNAVAGFFANAAKLKPIVVINNKGKASIFSKAFSREAAEDKLFAHLTELHQQKPIREYAIVHAHASEKAEQFTSRLKHQLAFEPTYTMPVSPVVGLHAGIGCVGVCITH